MPALQGLPLDLAKAVLGEIRFGFGASDLSLIPSAQQPESDTVGHILELLQHDALADVNRESSLGSCSHAFTQANLCHQQSGRS